MRTSVILLVSSLGLLLVFCSTSSATLIAKYNTENEAFTEEINRLSFTEQPFYFPKSIDRGPLRLSNESSLTENTDDIISMLLMEENLSVQNLSADDIMPVPEPATMILMGLGLFFIASMGKKILNKA